MKTSVHGSKDDGHIMLSVLIILFLLLLLVLALVRITDSELKAARAERDRVEKMLEEERNR